MDFALQIENLFKIERNRLISFINQMVGDEKEAEEILKDVFTNVRTSALIEQISIVDIYSKLSNTLRNSIINYNRKKRAEIFRDMQAQWNVN